MSWQKTPFVRLLLPLILGIVLSSYWQTQKLFGGLVVLGLGSLPFLLYWALKKRQGFRSLRVGGLLVQLFLFALGYNLHYLHNQINWAQHFGHQLPKQAVTFSGQVVKTPKLTAKSVGTVLQVNTLRDGLGQNIPTRGNLQTYIQLDTHSIKLTLGDRILGHGYIRAIAPPKNPHAFDAKQYYATQHIYHRVYLKDTYWQLLDHQSTWAIWLETVRSQMLKVLKAHLETPNEYAVAAALTLGARDAIDQDLKNAYADTGATHVLAVSGLHVGIITFFFGWLLGLIRLKKRWWKYTRTLIQVLLIWLFALLTGASPSVLRASTMFSFVAVGQALERKSSVYNTLAASAFLLLCINPNMLMNVGFQLSYIAVLGIVYLQPRIYRSWYIENKIGDKIWELTAVSIAAQIATLPISLYYFHQFPIFFWLSGLIVIPAAGVILALGLGLLVFQWVPVLSAVLGMALWFALRLMNTAIFGIQQLPASVWDGFWLASWEMFLWYGVILSLLWAWHQRKLKWLYIPVSMLLVLLTNHAWERWQQQQQKAIWVYHSPKGSLIDVFDGQRAFSMTDSTLLNQQRQYIHQANLWANGIETQQLLQINQDTLEGQQLWFSQKVFKFGAVSMLLFDQGLNQVHTHVPLSVDYVLVRDNPKLYSLEDLYDICDFGTVIFDASNPHWKVEKWKAEAEELDLPHIDILNEKARALVK